MVARSLRKPISLQAADKSLGHVADFATRRESVSVVKVFPRNTWRDRDGRREEGTNVGEIMKRREVL